MQGAMPDAREPMRSEKRIRAGMSTVGGQAAPQQPLFSSWAHCASLSSASDCTLLAGLPTTKNHLSTDSCHAKHGEADCALFRRPATREGAP